jgi:ribosomal protein L17
MAKLTYGDLITLARSNNSNERRQAFEAFQAWIKIGPKLQPKDRLTTTERHVLNQLFAQKTK